MFYDMMRVSLWGGSLIHSHYITHVKPPMLWLITDNVISFVYQTVWKTPEFPALRVLTHAEVTRVACPFPTCRVSLTQVPDLAELEWYNYTMQC